MLSLKNKQIATVQLESIKVLVDLNRYPEICPTCKMPARSESADYDLNGNDLAFYCINPHCICFDGAALKRKRHQIIEAMKETPSFRRHQHKLFRVTFRQHFGRKPKLSLA